MQRRTVFVVDDNEDLRASYVDLLVSAGYLVAEARDGESALSMLESRPPMLILLNLHTPKMNGFRLLAELRQDSRFSDIPVIMTSGYNMFEENAVELGVHFLEKPTEPKLFLSTVDELLKNHGKLVTPTCY